LTVNRYKVHNGITLLKGAHQMETLKEKLEACFWIALLGFMGFHLVVAALAFVVMGIIK
jgi:hypothetical protein